MSEKSKIEVSIGAFKFTGEGEEKWLTQQLDKILEKAEKIMKISPAPVHTTNTSIPSVPAGYDQTPASSSINVSLAKFLSDNNATKNQVKKFLGAAVWLSETKGRSQLKTGDVTQALKEAGQTKLANPSDALNKNVKKGHVEKCAGNEFIVTVHGKEEFGLK